MPNKISIAQEIYDRINVELSIARADEQHANTVLAELMPKVQVFPDAVAMLKSVKASKPQWSHDIATNDTVEMTPTVGTLKLLCLFGWADGILSADPSDRADFPRWAMHACGSMLSERREDLLETVGVADQARDDYRKIATRLIDVATVLLKIVGTENHPIPARPGLPIKRNDLWNIRDKLIELCELQSNKKQFMARSDAARRLSVGADVITKLVKDSPEIAESTKRGSRVNFEACREKLEERRAAVGRDEGIRDRARKAENLDAQKAKVQLESEGRSINRRR